MIHAWRRGLAGLLLALATSVAARPALDCPPPAVERAAAPSPGRWRHGLLWEVRSPEGATSHLFGTIHLTDPEILRLSPQLKALLAASREFGMEMRLDPDTLRGLAASVVAAPGRDLATRAEPALLAQATTLLEAYGIGARDAARLKPWAAWSTLALPPGAEGPPLDLVLMQAAEAAALPVFGLETLAEQVEIFDGLAPGDDLALLRDAICQRDLQARERESLVAAWKARDLASLYAQGLADDSPLQQRLMARMLHARNARMAARMLPHLREGRAFIAIGALHLPGTDGLLARLTAEGFAVKALE